MGSAIRSTSLPPPGLAHQESTIVLPFIDSSKEGEAAQKVQETAKTNSAART
jgi:hypothetical protein